MNPSHCVPGGWEQRLASYANKVQADIARWAAGGLIDAPTADRLRADVAARAGRGVQFGSVLTTLAGLLMIAAILLFISAGWEGIPRLGRMAILSVLILGGYTGGAVLKGRGQHAFGEALWLVAAGAFGASIALVGQMYHLSGDEADAVRVWCIGAGLAAVLLRSQGLSLFAVVLALGWLGLRSFESFEQFNVPWGFLPLAAGLWLVSLVTHSRWSRHLLVLGLDAFLAILVLRTNIVVAGTLIAGCAAVVFALAVRYPEAAQRFVRLGNGLAPHMLVLGLIGLGFVQGELAGEPTFILPSVAALAGVVAALLAGGRQSKTLRRVAYAAFGLEMVVIYAVMLGTMLGTAGFFFAAAVLLGLLAAFITRMERRLRDASKVPT